MKTVFIKELKLNMKSFLIWTLSVGGLGLCCILLYQSMQGDMKAMADAFSEMGAFSDAFGMSTLSIATLEGYFATEVGAVHGLGSAMFAAIIAVTILSKEEEGHSGEFLLSLPVSRSKVVMAKALSIVICLAAFTVGSALFYLYGFAALEEEVPIKEFVTFMGGQFLMNLEIAGICFAISSFSGKNRMGLGIGIAMLGYFYDVIGRVVPDMKDYLILGPYSFANASEIFAGKEVPMEAVGIAVAVSVVSVVLAFFIYNKRDLAS